MYTDILTIVVVVEFFKDGFKRLFPGLLREAFLHDNASHASENRFIYGNTHLSNVHCTIYTILTH